MNELMTDYQAQYERVLASNADQKWLSRLRQAAFDCFKEKGFPNRKVEDWKYTSVETLKKETFEFSKQKSNLPEGDAQSVLIQNGVVGTTANLELPKGVLVCSMRDAWENHPDLLSEHLGQYARWDADGFSALNLALFTDGICIFVPKNVAVKTPLYLEHQQTNDQSTQQLRHCIVLEKGASLTVIEDYYGDNELSYFTNCVTEVFADQQAQLNHYKLQLEGKKAYHIGHLHAHQARDSQVHSYSYSFGGRLVRSDTTIDLTDTGAHCALNGLYMTKDKQHVDHHTIVNHLAPHATSDEYYKGILSGDSKAVFNGRVIVAKDAQKTNASQQNKNLLLSKKAEVDTKPQLEIFADDVKCAHGATVGQLDDKALFYMRSRGIDETQAKELLVHAFAADVFDKSPITTLVERLKIQVNQQLLEVS